MNWLNLARQIEPLEGIALDAALVEEMQRAAGTMEGIDFYTPSFKSYATSEIAACGKNAWPAVSITGADCKLQCDHCKAKILAPMIPARTPEELWRVVQGLVANGA